MYIQCIHNYACNALLLLKCLFIVEHTWDSGTASSFLAMYIGVYMFVCARMHVHLIV